MTNDNIDAFEFQPHVETDEHLFDNWFNPIKSAVRDSVRGLSNNRSKASSA